MSAILFGSISTLADTSELQRQAFNDAFQAYGLDWEWSRDDYASMLGSNGGAQRIEDYAASRGADVDAAAVHAKKSEIFQNLLGSSSISPRPGVVETVEEAKRERPQAGLRHHHLTGQHRCAAGCAPAAHQRGDVRPHRQPRHGELAEARSRGLRVRARRRSVKTPAASWPSRTTSAGSAPRSAAGIRCIAFPNENTSGGDFSHAAETVDTLDASRIVGIATS